MIESVKRLSAAKHSDFTRQVLVGVFGKLLKFGAHGVRLLVQHAHQGVHQRVAAGAKQIALIHGQLNRRTRLRDLRVFGHGAQKHRAKHGKKIPLVRPRADTGD